ncbi:FAD-dependent oxidoreductase, partial [Thermus scotoductus]|uniref:FAD-dependent oxidoreductase n=1 Tax=Thermus scotoductus TaxID=37636 RepID=UPI001003FEF4
MIGALTAYELAKRGLQVVLLDAGKEGAATRASAGMLAPYPEGLSGELLEAGLFALDYYPELLAELRDEGFPVEAGFSGTFVVALGEGERAAWQAEEALPYPVRGGLGARRFPGGYLHAAALREALLALLARRGVSLWPVVVELSLIHILRAHHTSLHLLCPLLLETYPPPPPLPLPPSLPPPSSPPPPL